MKKLGLLVLSLLVACSFVYAGGSSESTGVTVTTAAPVTAAATTPAADSSTATDVPEEFHIGIVTGTVFQSEDDLGGAVALFV